jgi:hypothetical protein
MLPGSVYRVIPGDSGKECFRKFLGIFGMRVPISVKVLTTEPVKNFPSKLYGAI